MVPDSVQEITAIWEATTNRLVAAVALAQMEIIRRWNSESFEAMKLNNERDCF